MLAGGSLKDAAISAALGGATAGIAPSIGDTAAFALQGGARAAIAGGDFGDVLKGAGIGAAGAAAGKIFKPTLQNLLPGGKTVEDPFQAGLDNLSKDLGRTGSFFSDVTSGEIGKAFEPAGEAFKGLVTNPLGDAPKTIEEFLTPSPEASSSPSSEIAFTDITGPGDNVLIGGATGAAGDDLLRAPASITNPAMFDDGDIYDPLLGVPAPADPGIVDNLGAGVKKVTDYLLPSDPSAGDVLSNNPNVPPAIMTEFRATGVTMQPLPQFKKPTLPLKLLNQKVLILFKNTDLSRLLVRVPHILGGAFDVPEMQKPNILPSGFGQQGISPELVSKYRLSEGSLNTAPTRTSPISARVAPRRQSEILRQRFPDLFAAKDGGEVFPRRTGGIMPDEGVPGKDSVRAMVMPGEFIFTTDAVKGASPTGNLNDGINNMYSVMRKLESRGKRMA